METEQKTYRYMVSVILPVYNTAPWLEECLDSIVNQTLREIEIICINDGSTDDSLRILRDYQTKDCRIQIIDQENKGLSAARNAGMQIATGKYLYFLDSDDYLDLKALELLVTDMETRDLQILCFNVIPFGDDRENQKIAESKRSYYNRTMDEERVFTGQELFHVLWRNQNYLAPVWLNLILRSFCMDNGLWFHTGILHEDEAWTFTAMMCADRCGCKNKAFYHRRFRENSIMTSPMSFKRVYSYYYAIWDMLQTIETQHIQGEILEDVIMQIGSLQNIAVDNYRQCSDAEREKAKLLPAKEQILIHLLFTKLAGAYNEIEESARERMRAESELDALKKEISQLIHSKSFRAGQAITWLPRKARGGARCYAEHGFRYTMIRFMEHLQGIK